MSSRPPIRVAINGFGRIGRVMFRLMHAQQAASGLSGGARRLEVVAINDLGAPEALLNLLKFDSTHGRFAGKAHLEPGHLVVDGARVPLLQEKDPAKLPWASMGAPIVVESTGKFTAREQVALHLQAGAQKVLLTVPPKDALDALIVMGVNDETLEPEHRLVSNASCTTNCLAPMAKVLHERFGIVRGLMNTVHAYTNDQVILDLPHKDLRRARAAALNIIPTTTGAARAVGKVLPALAGKLDGFSVRVPVPDGSLVDLTAVLARDVTVAEVNQAMKDAAGGALAGLLRYSEEPIVSSDVLGDQASCVFDAPLTMVSGGTGSLVKVCGWYDNEVGYSARCVDLLRRMAG